MAKADRRSDEIMLRVLHLKLVVGLTAAMTARLVSEEFGVTVSVFRVNAIMRDMKPHL